MLSKVGERPKAGSGCSRSGAARFLGLGAAPALVGSGETEILLFMLPFLVFDDTAVWVVAVAVVVVVVVVLSDCFFPSVGDSMVSGG